MKAIRSLGLSLAVAFLSSACGGGLPPASASSTILEEGLPKFKRRTVNGELVSTKKPSRVTVVKFFAKYCEPCKKTLPAAQRIHEARPEVQFIGIAEDEYQTDVTEMINTYGLTFPVVHDQGNVLAGRFRVLDLPITFVADPSGKVRWVADAKHSEADLESAIEWASSTP